MKICGLRLLDWRQRLPIGYSRAILRLAASFVTVLTLGLGFLLIAVRKDRKSLHDLLAGTMVVRRLPVGVAGPPRRIGPVNEIMQAFAATGPVAKSVLAVLGIFSLFSWTLMLLKLVQLRRVDTGNRSFLDEFRRATRLADVQAAASKSPGAPLAGMFRAGYLELEAQVRVMERAARPRARSRVWPRWSARFKRANRRRGAKLLRYLPFLRRPRPATPFIGLFRDRVGGS